MVVERQAKDGQFVINHDPTGTVVYRHGGLAHITFGKKAHDKMTTCLIREIASAANSARFSGVPSDTSAIMLKLNALSRMAGQLTEGPTVTHVSGYDLTLLRKASTYHDLSSLLGDKSIELCDGPADPMAAAIALSMAADVMGS